MVSPPLRVKLSGFCVCLVKRERYTTLKYRRSWGVPDAPIFGFGERAEKDVLKFFLTRGARRHLIRVVFCIKRDISWSGGGT